jgi:hypothetical protein
MKSFRLILAIAASFALIAGFAFAADTQAPAPQKSGCCAQADKDAKKCAMECCAAAAKEGKACAKCAAKQEKKDEKK